MSSGLRILFRYLQGLGVGRATVTFLLDKSRKAETLTSYRNKKCLSGLKTYSIACSAPSDLKLRQWHHKVCGCGVMHGVLYKLAQFEFRAGVMVFLHRCVWSKPCTQLQTSQGKGSLLAALVHRIIYNGDFYSCRQFGAICKPQKSCVCVLTPRYIGWWDCASHIAKQSTFCLLWWNSINIKNNDCSDYSDKAVWKSSLVSLILTKEEHCWRTRQPQALSLFVCRNSDSPALGVIWQSGEAEARGPLIDSVNDSMEKEKWKQ